MDQLPPELLSQIFRNVVDNVGDKEHIQYLGRISRVQKLWLTVANDDPHLWSTIHPPFRPPYKPDDIQAWIDFCLDRSGSYPLKIRLHSMFARSIYLGSVLHLLRAIQAHSVQLVSLSITVVEGEQAIMDILSEPTHFPQLEFFELCLVHNDPIFSISHQQTVPLADNLLATNIHHLRLKGVDLVPDLKSLTFLDLCAIRPTYDSFCQLASSSPSLSVLVLRLLAPTFSENVIGALPITFPSLASFTVSCPRQLQRDAHGRTFVMQYLSFPNLEHLEIGGAHVLYTPLFHNSGGFTRLQTLRFNQFIDAQAEFTSIFHTLPALTQLHLVHTRATDLFRRSSFESHRNPFSGWSCLQVLLLDTIEVREVLWMCNLLSVHPEAFRIVYVSAHTNKHLSSSLQIVDDVISSVDSSFNARRLDWRPPAKERMVVKEWLERRVELCVAQPEQGLKWERGELDG